MAHTDHREQGLWSYVVHDLIPWETDEDDSCTDESFLGRRMMKTTIRRAIATTAGVVLALGATSVAAPAATSSDVTPDMVLTAASGIRTADAARDSYSPDTLRALRAIINRSCDIDVDGGEILWQHAGYPVTTGSGADGLVAYAYITNFESGTLRECLVGAVAPTTPGRTLQGTSTLTVATAPRFAGQAAPAPTTVSTTMTGPVSVSTPIIVPSNQYATGSTFSASGDSVETTQSSTSATVADPKSPDQVRAAQAVHDSKVKAAKKAYTKALKKAGRSKARKNAAKKSYNAKKASAAAAFRAATAPGTKQVTTTTSHANNTPLAVSLSAS